MALHGSEVYYTLESYLKSIGENEQPRKRLGKPAGHAPGTKEYNRHIRYLKRMTLRWNHWKERHPSEPLVVRCALCSGKTQKIDIKLGKWKISTRAEQKQLHKLTKEETE